MSDSRQLPRRPDPATTQEPPSVSDAAGHYDIDGVSFAFGRIIVASSGLVPFHELWAEPAKPPQSPSDP